MSFTSSLLSVGCSRVGIIALIYLVLILYGLVLTIQDMINEEYPLSWHEATYVVCYYLIHFLLIFLLFAGTKKKMPSLYLPWLAVFLAVFTTATCFWLESVIRHNIIYVVPSITNITVLGLGWLCWCIVLKQFLAQKSKNDYKRLLKD